MPCLFALLAYFAPRFAIVLLVLLSDYLGTAYETTLVPFLGFLFFPLTTLAYAWARHSHGSVEGLALAVVLLGLLMDLGIIGRTARKRRKKASEG
jgi:positive regulator of sigma E activity